MTEKLFSELDEAVNLSENVSLLSDAIFQLAKNEVATAVLLDAYRHNVLAEQKKWLEIEQLDDYKEANYSSRREAHEDFLAQCFRR